MKIRKKLVSGILPFNFTLFCYISFLLYISLLCYIYIEFEAEILDLQSEKYGLSFDIKKYTTSGGALGDENVIGIRAFKILIFIDNIFQKQRLKKNVGAKFNPICNPLVY